MDEHQPGFDDLRVRFVFVPDGEPVPWDWMADWTEIVRVPATLVLRYSTEEAEDHPSREVDRAGGPRFHAPALGRFMQPEVLTPSSSATPVPTAISSSRLDAPRISNLTPTQPSHSEPARIILAQSQTCAEFISENCKASILRVFPGQFLDVPMDDVLDAAKAGDAAARTARKLLLDNRFRK